MRLMVYDRTCTTHFGGKLPVGLTHSWAFGARVYSGLGRLDAWVGASNWNEALTWLLSHEAPIDEVQFWGHGNWGLARISGEPLTTASLQPVHPHHALLTELRGRMEPSSQWWFRTCETIGSNHGHRFAQQFGEFLGTAVAGHTFIIGPWQSGLHRLEPGAAPHWSPYEGMAEGTPDKPGKALWSTPMMPNTIHMLQGTVPDGW